MTISGYVSYQEVGLNGHVAQGSGRCARKLHVVLSRRYVKHHIRDSVYHHGYIVCLLRIWNKSQMDDSLLL
jgi:hypothetical protein